VTNTGAIIATSDDEIEKMAPVPSGCGENPLRRRCRPLNLEPPNRSGPSCLTGFSLATLSTPVGLDRRYEN